MLNEAAARRWIIISALVTFGVFFYTRTQSDQTAVISKGDVVKTPSGKSIPLKEFLTAWGAVYFILSLIAEAAPRFAGSMAILIMSGDILVNGQTLISSLNKALPSQAPTPATPATSSTTPATQPVPTPLTPVG